MIIPIHGTSLLSFIDLLAFIVITVVGLKQISNHFVAYNYHSIMHRYQLLLGHQIIYPFSLHVHRILFHLLYFFVTIDPNQSSLRLIGLLNGWGICSCSLITVPSPFEHLKFLRIPVTHQPQHKKVWSNSDNWWKIYHHLSWRTHGWIYQTETCVF